MIYDAFGNLITPEKRPDDRVVAVASLRDRYSGYPSRGLTPDKLGTIFREADGGDVYRQMELFEEMEEKDPHLFSIMQTRKLAVAGLDYEAAPFSEDKKDVEAAEFVSEVIYGLPGFEDDLMDMLDGIGKGYSVLEIYWDVRGGRNVARRLEHVHPKNVTWSNSVNPRLITEERPGGVDFPPFKFIFHRHRTRSGHPSRQGVLRVVAWMYLFKNYGIKDWVSFAEVYGMPLRIGKYDPSSTKEDKDALIQAVRALASDAAGVIPKSTEIEFVEAVKNSGEAVYEALADFCNAEMSKAVLGQTLTSQQGEKGSYSLGQVHDRVRGDILKADCEMAAKTIRRDLIRPLVGFNFGWDRPLPWFRFHYEEPEDLKQKAETIRTLVEAGFEGVPEDYVHEKFDIPKPKTGQRTLSNRGRQDSLPPAAANKACRVCMANKGGAETFPDQEAVDGAIDSLSAEELRKQMEGVLKPVVDMIEEGRGYEAILEDLAGAYPDMDDRAVEEMLARAIFVAEAWGRINANG